MALADDTAREILRALEQHLDKDTTRAVVKSMRQHVHGNRMFRDTILKLDKLVEVREPWEFGTRR